MEGNSPKEQFGATHLIVHLVWTETHHRDGSAVIHRRWLIFWLDGQELRKDQNSGRNIVTNGLEKEVCDGPLRRGTRCRDIFVPCRYSTKPSSEKEAFSNQVDK